MPGPIKVKRVPDDERLGCHRATSALIRPQSGRLLRTGMISSGVAVSVRVWPTATPILFVPKSKHSRVEGPVLFPGDIAMFRAKQRFQDKAQSAGNGASLSRTATPDWNRCLAPCGRAGKRSPAALRRLSRTRHSLRGAPCAQPLPDPLNMAISPGKSTRQGDDP